MKEKTLNIEQVKRFIERNPKIAQEKVKRFIERLKESYTRFCGEDTGALSFELIIDKLSKEEFGEIK